MPTNIEFLRNLSEGPYSNLDRAIAVIWWNSREDHSAAQTAGEIADQMRAAGYARQNVSRLKASLAKDSRTAKEGQAFRVRVGARDQLDKKFGEIANFRTVTPSDSVLPLEVFHGTRGYIEKVVKQINGSFDVGHLDCTAVMCRRLLETLIIEAFEHLGCENELKGRDGNYLMFSGLLSVVETSNSISLSRNGLAGLKAYKKLGDLSAHNRRFNAVADDITRVRDGIRVAAQELLHVAGLA